MADHLEVSKLSGPAGEVLSVRLLDKKLIDPISIQEVAEEIDALVDEGHTKLVIVFARVEMLTSPFLNALIKLRIKVLAKSGAIRLCQLSPVLIEVFGPMIGRGFPVYPTEHEALADF